ncbi:MAG: hypothetical protein N3A53_06515, partial [Verrucomicrobiae bacterium]|nr:hypothetical protein [Verrucomicrobiae bacterium]
MPDTFRISPGDTVLLTVTALRKDGFGNEIHLAAQQLPAGFTASEGTIRAGQTEGHITITAPRDPSVPLFTPRIIGKAKTTDTELLRIAEPTEELTQAFSYKHFVPTEELIFTISDQPPFTLTVNLPSNAPITITPESETQIPVKVSRKAGLQGEISLAIFAPPPGISIKPTVIPPDKDETTAVIVAAKDVAVGTRHQLFLTGTLKTAGYTDTRYAPAITIQFAPKQP